jgi:hypothetical protein
MQLIFFISYFIMAFIEYRENHSLFTPFLVLTIPISTAILYNNLFASNFRGYYEISDITLFWLLLYFICFWIVGQLFFLVLRKKPFFNYSIRKRNYQTVISHIKRNQNLFILFLWISNIPNLLRIILLIKKYGLNIFSSQMEGILDSAYQHGIVAHLRIFGFIPFILLFTLLISEYSTKLKRREKLFYIISLIIFFGLVIVGKSKYHGFLLFLQIIFFLSAFNLIPKVKIKHIILILFLVFFLFSFSYFITHFRMDSSSFINILKFTINHFERYFLGGMIALNTIVLNYISAGNFSRLFARFIDAFNILIGEETMRGSSLWVEIREGSTVNIFTFFGSLIYNVGFFGTFIYTFITAFISYMFLLFSKAVDSLLFKLLMVNILSVLTLGFFANLFQLLFPWEEAILSIITIFAVNLIDFVVLRDTKKVNVLKINYTNKD